MDEDLQMTWTLLYKINKAFLKARFVTYFRGNRWMRKFCIGVHDGMAVIVRLN